MCQCRKTGWQAGRQANDASDKTLTQNACANAALSPAPEKHAVRQDDRRFASALQAFEHVQQKRRGPHSSQAGCPIQTGQTRLQPDSGR